MAKTWGKVSVVIVVVALVLAWNWRYAIGQYLSWGSIKPAQSFAQIPAPSAPDYADPANWAALPETTDPADAVPDPAMAALQAAAPVDVFFIHPTTYIDKAGWNQPPDHVASRALLEAFSLRPQAGVFNSCCRVYAPRYRQATLYAFADKDGNGEKALDLAYGDVERAFDQFIAERNQGRPFILAGHSQGSLHLWRLLQRRITGTPLRERMVAAYAIGFALSLDERAEKLPDILVCAQPDQVGCLLSWNAVGPEVEPWGDPSKNVCVNPLNWQASPMPATFEQNPGAVSFDADGKPTIEPGAADARCEGGLLRVSEIRSRHYDKRPLGRDNFHVYDYNLYALSIRENAVVRTRNFLATQ